MSTVLQQLSVSGGVLAGGRQRAWQGIVRGSGGFPAQAREPDGARDGFVRCTVVAHHAPTDAKPEGWDAGGAGNADSQTACDSDATVWGTDDALAISFTRRYHRDWRYVALWGKWLMWDGRRWRAEDTLAASDLIRQVCRHAAVRADNSKVAAKLDAVSGSGHRR